MSILSPLPQTLANIRRYLISHGWFPIEHPNERIEIFETKPRETGEYGSVTLPRSTELRDAGQLLNETVRLVADFENTAIEKIVDYVLRWDRDILRPRFFKIHGTEESLPLGIAADVVTCLKEFVGYAAYTHTDPRPFFDKVGAIGSAFVDQCRFGHTFHGSFGLTIECPFATTAPLLTGQHQPAAPLERQIFERLAIGFLTLKESVSSESIDPLLEGYLTGFNANMCRKLAQLYEQADGRRVEFDISWSPQIHSACEGSWKPFLFEGRAYECVRVAAAELEKAETFLDSLVEGRIVALKSDMPPGLDEQAEFEHIITMFWTREKGQTVKIRVLLTPEQYIDACDAHKEGRAIRVYGTPEKAGKFWTLNKVHDFTVLL